MSKRSRLVLILVVLAVCFAFLWPSVKWYYVTPKQDQSLALGSREKIKDYARNMAVADLKKLMEDARADTKEAVDSKFNDLIAEARKNYKAMKKDIPAVWTARALLAAYPSESDILGYIENGYRDRILAMKKTQGGAVKLGLDLSG